MEEADAAPYLEAGLRANDDDTPADLDDGLPDVEPEERARDLTPEAFPSAACRWLRETAANNTVGERSRRFRVRVFAPKANHFIFSATFVCHDEADDGDPDDAPLRLPDLPSPSWDQAVTDTTMKPLRALGDGYAQFMKLVMATVGQAQGLNNSMHSRQHRQLREAQDQVEQLVASILEFRAAQVEAQEQRKADEHTSDARTELARHAIKQLGDAAQAFVLARGLPPDLAEVFGALGASPELMATLRDPSVRVLMKDPDNLRCLATMLRAAGAQAAAAQAAANGVSATTADTTPPRPPRADRPAGRSPPMPSPTPETPSTPAVPVWLATARRFYAQGFEVRTDAQMAGSVADWAELPVHEQTFTCAHLLYLNLVAQRGTQRLLERVLGALDEVADALAGFEEPEADDNEDEDQPPDPAPAAATPLPATTPPAPAAEVEVLGAEDDSPAVEVEVLDGEDDSPAAGEADAA